MAKKNKDVTNWRNDKKDIFGFLGDNKKILMPAILVVAVAVTIVIALSANKRTAVNVQTNTAETEASVFEIPQQEMELNAYPEVNALVEKYYEASANGDSDTLSSIYKGLDDTEILKAVAASEYIEKFENIDVYTKPGPVPGSYVAYVYNEVKLYEYDGDVPGLETLYICTDDSGNLYINGDIADINELDYLKQINVQADVIDLNNKVATSYNEMVSADEKLAELLTKMRSGLQVSVGEALATSEAAAPNESSEGSSDDGADDDTVVVSRVIKATDVINIRSSDSETADILDRTTKGQEFTEIEALANGWSKIQFKDTEAYVKTEFFDVVSEERVAASDVSSNTEENAEGEDQNGEETSSEAASSASTTSDQADETSSEASSAASEASSSEETGKAVSSLAKGKMVVTDSVKLRKGQGTDTEAVTTIYAGESVNVVEQYANGWAKVEFKNKTGYIKSEYLRQ